MENAYAKSLLFTGSKPNSASQIATLDFIKITPHEYVLNALNRANIVNQRLDV